MKAFWLLAAALGVAGISVGWGQSKPTVVIIGGDTLGYLSPCGCTKPMMGGIRRRMTLTRQLSLGRESLVLENGGLANGNLRQDILKAEAMAEILATAGVDAVHFSPQERKLGLGGMASLLNFGDGFWVDSQRKDHTESLIRTEHAEANFRVFAVSSQPAATLLPNEVRADWRDSITTLRQSAAESKQTLILLFGGGLEDAANAARSWPELDVIVYRSKGLPQPPSRVGSTWLVSPADHGKYLVTFEWSDGTLKRWRRLALTEDVPNDPRTQRTYADYLKRVTQEGLLAQLPKSPSEKFAGNKKCISCHATAGKVWQNSSHSRALTTLHKEGHHRDPDCVGCHVVGLHFEGGFRTEVSTPQLKHVGCESCHGPGERHAQSPYKIKMPPMGSRACLPCHTPDHSPNFRYDAHWKLIQH